MRISEHNNNNMSTAPTSSSWTVEIDHPDGTTRRPAIRDAVEFRPTINGLPEIEVPLRRDDEWLSSAWEQQPMRVWFEGKRVPIDELVSVEPEPGQYTLVGRGGSELTGRVREEFRQREGHKAAEDIITAETSYASNVNDPGGAPSENLLASISTQDDWLDAVAIADDEPVEVANGELRTLQSLFFREAEVDTGTAQGTRIEDEFSDNEALIFSSTVDNVDYDFTPGYDCPQGDVEVGIRFQVPGDGHPGLVIKFDGTKIEEYPADSLIDNENSMAWDTATTLLNEVSWTAGQESTLSITVDEASDTTSGNNGELWLDCVAMYDTGDRFSPTFSYTFSEDASDGDVEPETHPQEFDVVTRDYASSFAIIGGRADATISSTANNQAIAISADDGATWFEETNATEVEQDFNSSFPDIRMRFTLSRSNSGLTGQSVSNVDLFADIDETPLLVNQPYDARGVDVLNDIAEFGDYFWEVIWDEDVGGFSIEWTSPGQRISDGSTDVQDFSVTKSNEDAYKKVVIYGGGKAIQDEPLTADHDTWVSLDNTDLVSGGETIQADGSDTTYSEGDDYEIQHQAGEVKVLSTGAVADGADLDVSYEYKVSGDAETGDYTTGEDQVLREDIPQLTTSSSCDQAALYLLESVSKPQYSAQVELTRDPTDAPLVESRAFAEVPLNGNRLEVQTLTRTAGGVEAQMGSRQPAEELLGSLQRQISQVTQRA